MFVPIVPDDSGYEITNSLRLNGSSSYLSASMGAPTDALKFTIHASVKRGTLGAWFPLYGGYTGSNAFVVFGFDTLDQLVVRIRNSSAVDVVRMESAAVFRDPAAHYNITIIYDSANATASQRVRVFVDDKEITSWATATYAPLNQALTGNTQSSPQIGRFNVNSTPVVYYGDGYVSNYHYIDGQALEPSYFGGIDPATGQWKAQKYEGTYGAIGFRLRFINGSSTVTLGNDDSGNNNHFTLTNMVRAAGVNDCWMTDTPSNNFATLNGIYAAGTQSNGNLTQVSATTAANARSTIPLNGKTYWEVTCDTANVGVGICNELLTATTYPATSAYAWGYIGSTGSKYNGSAEAYGAAFTANDVIGIAFDASAGTLEFFKNGVSQGVAFTGLIDAPYFAVVFSGSAASTTSHTNFGQREFSYSPPAGFKTLCTQNLPSPSIKLPKKHFDIALSAGTSAPQSVTGLGFKPDLLWSKCRSTTGTSHVLADSSRGSLQVLQSDLTNAEATFADSITSLNEDGFTLGASNQVNLTGRAYGEWLWKAGGAPVANTDGSITAQVSANPVAGFSIVTYTGTGVNATVGHGLGVAPKLVIVKRRDAGATNWYVYHSSLGNTDVMVLNLTNAKAVVAAAWNNTSPDSTALSLGTNTNVNAASGELVAYCFSEIPGFSKIGSYTGNGLADGPFVHCGFKPKYVLMKRADAGSNWWIFDTARSAFNLADAALYPDLSNAETITTASPVDILSNGFKVRSATYNVSGGTYIFIAFAEAPFNYATAR